MGVLSLYCFYTKTLWNCIHVVLATKSSTKTNMLIWVSLAWIWCTKTPGGVHEIRFVFQGLFINSIPIFITHFCPCIFDFTLGGGRGVWWEYLVIDVKFERYLNVIYCLLAGGFEVWKQILENYQINNSSQ